MAVGGYRSEYDDEEYRTFLKYMASFMEKTAFAFPDNYISWLRWIRTDKVLTL